jgi:transporter family protein
MFASWVTWALLSAVFAALTAIFAKIGVQDVDSDLATLLRTCVVFIALGALVIGLGKWSNPTQLSSKTLVFLVLSGLATAASWLCYFRALQIGPVALVAPIDKFSVVLVAVFAFAALGERLSLREWIGVGLITSGIVLIALRR